MNEISDKRSFPNYLQKGPVDCGFGCLNIIELSYGRKITLRKKDYYENITKRGVSLYNLCRLLRKYGYKSTSYRLTFEELKSIIQPSIVILNNTHYVVVYKITDRLVYTSDPIFGLVHYNIFEFIAKWTGYKKNENRKGIAIRIIQNK